MLELLATQYTKEAGVRSLERAVASLGEQLTDMDLRSLAVRFEAAPGSYPLSPTKQRPPMQARRGQGHGGGGGGGGDGVGGKLLPQHV